MKFKPRERARDDSDNSDRWMDGWASQQSSQQVLCSEGAKGTFDMMIAWNEAKAERVVGVSDGVRLMLTIE